MKARRWAAALLGCGKTAFFCSSATILSCAVQPSAPPNEIVSPPSPSVLRSPGTDEGAAEDGVADAGAPRDAAEEATADTDAESPGSAGTPGRADRAASPRGADTSTSDGNVDEAGSDVPEGSDADGARVTAQDVEEPSLAAETPSLIAESRKLVDELDLSALDTEQKNRVEMVRTLLEDARKALELGDASGAHKLAEKAVLIARDLVELHEE